jgi:hypothetical protein
MIEKACVQIGAIDPSCDEYNSGSVIGVGPAIELNGRMKYVMDTMNNHGRGLTDQVEDILDAQEILPPPFVAPGRAIKRTRHRGWSTLRVGTDIRAVPTPVVVVPIVALGLIRGLVCPRGRQLFEPKQLRHLHLGPLWERLAKGLQEERARRHVPERKDPWPGSYPATP